MNDFATFSQTIVAFVSTYMIHSTLLLSACWLVLTTTRAQSHFLTERLWKRATVLGIVTAFAQVAIGPTTFPFAIFSPAEPSVIVATPSERGSRDAQNDDLMPDISRLIANSDWPAPAADTRFVVSEPSVASSIDTADLAVEFPPPLRDGNVDSAVVDDRVKSSSIESINTIDKVVLVASTGEGNAQPNEDSRDSKFGQAKQVWLPVCLRAIAVVFVSAFAAGGLLLLVQTTRLRLRFGGARLLRNGTARSTLDRFAKRHKIRRRIRLLVSNKHGEPIAH